MFQVLCVSPIDDKWEERDIVIYQTAGRKSDEAGADKDIREHSWNFKELKDAVKIKNKLNELDDVFASVRER